MSRKKKVMTRKNFESQIIEILRACPKGVKPDFISDRLRLQQREVHLVWDFLRDFERKKVVIRSGKNLFRFASEAGRFTGVLKRKISGAGEISIGETNTIVHLHENNLVNFADGDRIQVQITGLTGKNRLRGEVVKLIKRRELPILGYFHKTRRGGFVVPVEPKIAEEIQVKVPAEMKINDKELVTVELVEPEGRSRRLRGKIIQILGRRHEDGVESAMLIFKHGLSDEFPADTLSEAESVPDSLNEEDLAGRKDLRTEWAITVDPASARDFDDALSLIEKPDGYRLGVHIADVAHYVKPETAIDREAYNRGTSVYFPDRAVHMLPERLAANLCSLRPNVDRLTMTVWIDLDSNGAILGGSCEPSVINSHGRLTYAEFLAASQNTPPDGMEPETCDLCIKLANICRLLLIQRVKRGVLDLEIPEAQFELDAAGQIVGIHKKPRSIAEQTIEEFMIAANIIVARFLDTKNIRYLRRVHEPPDLDSINDLKESLGRLGIIAPENPLNPDQARSMLAQIELPAIRSVASYQILRCMKRAVYTASGKGHFGLALPEYTQFTSPIRRYPDLEVHRAVKSALAIPNTKSPTINVLNERAKWLSERERAAQEAEWDAVKWQKIRFMKKKVGEKFLGTITHLEEFGAFVEIDEPFVEGLIPIYRMSGYYTYNADANTLTCREKGIVLKTGKQVWVEVEKADIDRGLLDFTLAEAMNEPVKNN